MKAGVGMKCRDLLTVDANGAATLYDTLRVLKRDEGLVVVAADGR